MRKNKLIYFALTVPVIGIGMLCGYFLIHGETIGTVNVSADFFADYWNLSRILLLQFIFGFSVLAVPVCYLSLFYQSLIYGYSIFLINSLQQPMLAVFCISMYVLILSVYVCTSVKSITLSKTMIPVIPRIKSYMKYACLLLLLQVIKSGFLILFY